LVLSAPVTASVPSSWRNSQDLIRISLTIVRQIVD
jgi:hypothetical protein